jgi:hypothetical protein
MPRARYLVQEFNMNNWPTHSAQASVALEGMRRTHRVRPLMAYDLENEIIHPKDYRSKLKGALVQIWFTLTRDVEPGYRGKPPLEIFIAYLSTIRMIDKAMPLRRLLGFAETHRSKKREAEGGSDEEPEQSSRKRVRRSKRLTHRA